MIFNILMFAAPFIGLWLIGPIGLLIGMSVACIGWIYLFFILGRREGSCAICGRLVLNVGHSNFGVMFRTDAMMKGEVGPGKECQRCGRIYCSYCTNYTSADTVCICGSKSFRIVGLRYR
jgi:hypothetical protein